MAATKKWLAGFIISYAVSTILIGSSLYCLQSAWVMLLQAVQTGDGSVAIPGLHDAGIAFSFAAFVLLFVVFAYMLQNNRKKRVSAPWAGKRWILWNSDFYYILVFFVMMFAWAGIWVCMHFAFLVELEVYLTGRVPASIIPFSLATFLPSSMIPLLLPPLLFDPPTLHYFGLWLVVFIWIVLTVFGAVKALKYGR